MDTNKEAPGVDRERIPETVTLRATDRMTYGALGYDGNKLMAFTSGYDLEIEFNLRLINPLADAEAYANALARVFYDALMEQLLCNEKADFVKPPGHKPATLSEKEGRNNIRQNSEHTGWVGRETAHGAGTAILQPLYE